MKRVLAPSGLTLLAVVLASFSVSGCGTFRFVKASEVPEQDPFEDVMVTGSHIVYRVPKDTTIRPIHQPPPIAPLDSVTVDIVDSGPRL